MLSVTCLQNRTVIPKDLEDSLHILVEDSHVQLSSTIAVAVSGGSDSLALVYLLKDLVNDSGSKFYQSEIVALIVDHGIRENSNTEAKFVQKQLENININSIVLKDSSIKIAGSIQNRARELRYKLLTDFCTKSGIKYLLVAHTFNDLVETWMMNMARGKNIWGDYLGMKSKVALQMNAFSKPIILLRPLLNFQKFALRNYLQVNNISYLEDPSNRNEEFERVRVRKKLIKQSESFLVEKLVAINQALALRFEMTKLVTQFIYNQVKITQFGEIFFSKQSFDDLECGVKKISIGVLVKFCAGSTYMPSPLKIASCLNFIASGAMGCYTLGNTTLYIQHGNIYLYKEYRNISQEIIKSDDKQMIIWDDRFLILCKIGVNQVIKKLDRKSYLQLRMDSLFSETIKNHPIRHNLIFSLPWLFINGIPVPIWLDSLIDKSKVRYKDIKSIYNDFSNFTLAKGML